MIFAGAAPKLSGNRCTDLIGHREDFTSKEEFNNHLDRRIMGALSIKEGQTVSLEEILDLADRYLESIQEIYRGNDIPHTEARRVNVLKGVEKLNSQIKK